jgi:ArsR family transcriptional regulator
MPAVKTDFDVVPALRALGDPIRWRIVRLLAQEQLCVCHLVDELGIVQPLVSHHLKAMREAGLVETERYSYWTYYRLKSDALRSLQSEVGAVASTTSRTLRRRPCPIDDKPISRGRRN